MQLQLEPLDQDQKIALNLAAHAIIHFKEEWVGRYGKQEARGRTALYNAY